MAEEVNIKYGHLTVLPERMMGYVRQTDLSDAEVKRICKQRIDYLHWVNRMFAHEVTLAPERFL